MTKKLFLTVLFFAASVNLFAQTAEIAKPDYGQIKRNIENEQSDFYYPKLWDRYQQGDSTMALDEKRHLYYGYVFNKNYSPYSTADNSEKINALLSKENPTDKDWRQLIALINTALAIEPFSCRYLFYQSVAFDKLGQSDDKQKNVNKINCVLDALLSTGDGLQKETAIHVITVGSEYDHLFFNNLSAHSQALVDGGFDVLDVGVEKLWFDVNRPFSTLKEQRQFRKR